MNEKSFATVRRVNLGLSALAIVFVVSAALCFGTFFEMKHLLADQREMINKLQEKTDCLLPCKYKTIKEKAEALVSSLQQEIAPKLELRSDDVTHPSKILQDAKERPEHIPSVPPSPRARPRYSRLPAINNYPPKVSLPVGPIYIKEGDHLSISCHVTGLPTPKVTWYKILGSLPKNRSMTNESRLNVKTVQKQDSGLYVCSGSNSLGSTIGTVKIVVVTLPKFITTQPQKIYKKQDDTLKLECQASGDPPAVITWSKENEQLPSERTQLRNGRLVITKFKRTDAGRYVCTAVSAGVATSKSTTMVIFQDALVNDCDSALGMQSGIIKDSQITASSKWDNRHGTANARLNFAAVSGRTGAWSAKTNNQRQWIQIDFGGMTNISRVATQGRQDADQWVTKYKLSYSKDGTVWNELDKEFSGNTDRSSTVINVLCEKIESRFLRVHPIEWHGHISMRLEFFGCGEDIDSLTFSRQSVDDYIVVSKKLPRMTKFSLCLWMRPKRTPLRTKLDKAMLSYAEPYNDNELLIDTPHSLHVYIGFKSSWNSKVSVNDGKWHHVCATWDNTAGRIVLYTDGVQKAQGTISIGHVINGGGTLVIGQDQDEMGGKFVEHQAYVGQLTGINMWSRVLGPREISALSKACKASSSGDILMMNDVISGAKHGQVKIIPAKCVAV